MKEYIHVICDERVVLVIQEFKEIKDAIKECRRMGIIGRLELVYIIIEQDACILYKSVYVNKDNQITGQIFPHKIFKASQL